MIRLAIQQRVIPAYRVPFLELLASQADIQLGVFAGAPRKKERINFVDQLDNADYQFTKNLHILDGKFYFCVQPEFKKWVKEWQPDILVVEANPRYLSTPGAIKWMSDLDKPIIGWGLGVPEYKGFLSSIRNHSRQNFFKSISSIIAYSQKGAQQYMQAGFPAEQVYVATNATAPAPVDPPPNRSDFSYNRSPILLYVGRLQKRKRIDSLIRVCSILPKEIQPELWIVGDGSIRSELESLANTLYPKTKLWGEKFGVELEEIFRKADLFVLPGTGGLAVQQAMSFGLPVIVAEGDGTQSDLVNQDNGWNIQPNNEQQLYDTILLALNSPKVVQKMGEAAYSTVKTQVNIENMVSVFLQASKDALARGKNE